MRRRFSGRLKKIGGALIAVVFMMIIMAGAVLMMSSLVNIQNASSILAMQGTRARLAAYSGLEWILYRLNNVNSNCPVGTETFTLSEKDLTGFSVSIDCTSQNYTEGGDTITLYNLAAIAEYGSLGDAGYVYRELTAVIEF